MHITSRSGRRKCMAVKVSKGKSSPASAPFFAAGFFAFDIQHYSNDLCTKSAARSPNPAQPTQQYTRPMQGQKASFYALKSLLAYKLQFSEKLAVLLTRFGHRRKLPHSGIFRQPLLQGT